MDQGTIEKDTHKEDWALVEAFQKGDDNAFEILVTKYRHVVYNLCYRYVGNRENADDLAQDVYIKVYKALPRFRCDARFLTWLYTITLNTCKSRVMSLRYRYERTMVSMDAPIDTEEGSMTIQIGQSDKTPYTETESHEKGVLIQQAIQSLPKEYKSLVLLRDIEGLSYEEITETLGMKMGTFKSKLSRARMMLRNKLNRYFPDEL